jgi:hypothetical protein
MEIGNKIAWLNLVVSFYNTGVIWLIQGMCYPLFGAVGAQEWPAYHREHWRRLRLVVFAPAILALLCALLLLVQHPAGAPLSVLRLGLALQMAGFLLTAGVWAPMHRRLTQEGNHLMLLRRLLLTHWLRVVLVTAYAILSLWWMLLVFHES